MRLNVGNYYEIGIPLDNLLYLIIYENQILNILDHNRAWFTLILLSIWFSGTIWTINVSRRETYLYSNSMSQILFTTPLQSIAK